MLALATLVGKTISLISTVLLQHQFEDNPLIAIFPSCKNAKEKFNMT